MNDQPEAAGSQRNEASRKLWEKPELVEIAIDEVTASPYALGGNDGTPGFTTIS